MYYNTLRYSIIIILSFNVLYDNNNKLYIVTELIVTYRYCLIQKENLALVHFFFIEVKPLIEQQEYIISITYDNYRNYK